MRSRPLLAALLAYLVVLWWVGPGFTQTGLVPITPEKWKRIPKGKPPARGYGDMPYLDLRPLMPPVGNQGPQGSCLAWALAYACKTAEHARDTQQRPDTPDRQFSPAFLYNQLVWDGTGGLHFLETLELLKTQGCATLATMPYREYDWQSQPSAEAYREARQYRISGYRGVETATDIRGWLQLGHPVVIGIQTNADFRIGQFDLFTRERWKLGGGRAEAFAPHGRHAMCVVGYDDRRGETGAFLVMNSWGSNWCWGGYCWIAYDLMRTVGPYPENYCFEAYVLDNTNPDPGPAIDQTVTVAGSTNYTGFRNQDHHWTWTAYLNGSGRLLQRIDRVVWKIPDLQGGHHAVTRSDASDRFAVGGQVHRAGSFTVVGTVFFKDRTQREVRYTLTTALPAQRSLKLAQTDRFWGRASDGKKLFQWTVKLDGSLTDLSDVHEVTYHLHPTFPDPHPVVRGSKENGFAFTTIGWGTFLVKATVRFLDGSTMELEIPLRFRDQVQEELKLTNRAEPIPDKGTNGETFFHWTAFIVGPRHQLAEIKKVHYVLHPTFDPRVVDIVSGADYGFPMFATGWGEFELRAVVEFKDGTTRELRHWLQFSDGATKRRTK